MAWHELTVDLPRGLVDRASGVLFSLGAAGLQEDWLPGEAPPPRQPWDRGPAAPLPALQRVRTWFEDPDRDAINARLVAALPEARPAWSAVAEQDWEESWKQHFPVLEVSPRLVVAPPWEASPGALIVEPGQGFGTGHHPTTRAVLRAVDALAPGGARDQGLTTALDVGCGSGILAIAAARLGLTAAGMDIDPVAVDDARRNAERNGVDVEFSTTPVERCAPADLVLGNLHAELAAHLAPGLLQVTRRWLVLAGILADREGLVREAFVSLELVEREADGEWLCLWYRRR
jgi:ribosomal protein L11 methyltransferase